ncbi:MAG TPA: M56 family metallopeptidase [Myxococcaceae bacterium]|nr:M56 family metallopeptidase [Myxococcaceae bacterium]
MNHAVFETLGWVLLHLLWQGALVAGGLALALAVVGKRAASARYLLACGALVLMLALPVATGWRRFASEPALSSASEAPALVRVSTARPSPATAVASVLAPSPVRAAPEAAPWLDRARAFLGEHMRWLVLAWGLGVIVSSARLLSGWLRLRRLVREAQPAPAEWQDALERLSRRLRLPRTVRLLQTAALEVPAAVGWLRPVVLLPVSALTGLTAKQLEMVLAHELAHVLRYDFAVNVAQTLVETLLFYHPAVWWISSVIRAERENCCDDIAVRSSGNPISYARALTALEALRVPALVAHPGPAMSALGGSLTDRVRRLVGVPARATRCLPVASMLTLLGGLAVAAPLAALGVPTSSAVVAASGPTGGEVRPSVPAGSPEPRRSAQVAAATAVARPPAAPVPNPNLKLNVNPIINVNPKVKIDLDPGHGGEDGDEDDKTRVDAKLSVDQLVALKVAGVTPEKVAELESLGYEPTVGTLVAFGHAGMTPEYAKQMTAALGRKPTADELTQMKHLGVTVERIQALKAAGYPNLSPEDLAHATAVGVDERYVRELSAAGYDKVPFDDLVQLRALGVDGKYVSELASAGYAKLPAEELAHLKALGVDAAYVRAMREAGFDKLPAEELAHLKALGVDQAFIRKLRDQGFDKLSVDELIRLRAAGIDADFIQKLRDPRK